MPETEPTRRRDPADPEIWVVELVPTGDGPPPEECTRLVIVFRQLHAAFPAIGITSDRGWDLLTRLALDSVPTPLFRSDRQLA